MNCKFEYSVEMLRNGVWEKDTRFYFAEVNPLLKDNSKRRNFKFIKNHNDRSEANKI